MTRKQEEIGPLLSTMLYRIWGKIRHPDCQEWDRRHAGIYAQALEGRGVLAALYKDELEQEAAVASGKEVLGMFLDLTKYYDQVALQLLLQDGIQHRFPLASPLPFYPDVLGSQEA